MARRALLIVVALAFLPMGRTTTDDAVLDSAWRRAQRTPIPAALQPPDPCDLLTPEDGSTLLGSPVVEEGGALATVDHPGRSCFWSGSADGLLSINTDGQRAARAARQFMEPATHLQFYVTVASAFEMHNSTPLSGLGDRASTSSDGSGVMVDVVVGDTGLELNFVRLHGPVDGAAVTALARSAVSRLPASSLPSSPG